MSNCSGRWNKACNYLFLKEKETSGQYKLNKELLLNAQQELEQAKNLFARVDDPDMMDYAIYNLRAAEERYNFLIKKYKQQHLVP